MTSLGLTLMENNVMEAGRVMSSSYRHSICTLEKAGKKIFLCIFLCTASCTITLWHFTDVRSAPGLTIVQICV